MGTRVDGRLLRGERTRNAVLDAAVALATEAGLSGLSLGQLADRLGVSKSGLFAHWRSKEELQLATVERASEHFIEHIVVPALRAPRGVRRLWAMHEYKLAYERGAVLPGGCFFTNAQFEYDTRPGPIRDRLADALAQWMATLVRLSREAIDSGELRPEVSPQQLAFDVNAASAAVVYQARLLPAAEAFALARGGVLHRLRALCTDPDLLPED
ncbi:TetR/AcrR family transcriptional regulator [Rhizomonospora bruguierae]|uniref:TetR/AcrR family transcriptional regulator n=1 Tax=Rhizomonospora bruguierae TaxID=1581705 RepID=UPI001BCBD689|nr:TetR/AcrR family transcriptional regulator [Micromonospora sp. NBRC 107566]